MCAFHIFKIVHFFCFIILHTLFHFGLTIAPIQNTGLMVQNRAKRLICVMFIMVT